MKLRRNLNNKKPKAVSIKKTIEKKAKQPSIKQTIKTKQVNAINKNVHLTPKSNKNVKNTMEVDNESQSKTKKTTKTNDLCVSIKRNDGNAGDVDRKINATSYSKRIMKPTIKEDFIYPGAKKRANLDNSAISKVGKRKESVRNETVISTEQSQVATPQKGNSTVLITKNKDTSKNKKTNEEYNQNTKNLKINEKKINLRKRNVQKLKESFKLDETKLNQSLNSNSPRSKEASNKEESTSTKINIETKRNSDEKAKKKENVEKNVSSAFEVRMRTRRNLKKEDASTQKEKIIPREATKTKSGKSIEKEKAIKSKEEQKEENDSLKTKALRSNVSKNNKFINKNIDETTDDGNLKVTTSKIRSAKKVHEAEELMNKIVNEISIQEDIDKNNVQKDLKVTKKGDFEKASETNKKSFSFLKSKTLDKSKSDLELKKSERRKVPRIYGKQNDDFVYYGTKKGKDITKKLEKIESKIKPDPKLNEGKIDLPLQNVVKAQRKMNVNFNKVVENLNTGIDGASKRIKAPAIKTYPKSKGILKKSVDLNGNKSFKMKRINRRGKPVPNYEDEDLNQESSISPTKRESGPVYKQNIPQVRDNNPNDVYEFDFKDEQRTKRKQKRKSSINQYDRVMDSILKNVIEKVKKNNQNKIEETKDIKSGPSSPKHKYFGDEDHEDQSEVNLLEEDVEETQNAPKNPPAVLSNVLLKAAYVDRLIKSNESGDSKEAESSSPWRFSYVMKRTPVNLVLKKNSGLPYCDQNLVLNYNYLNKLGYADKTSNTTQQQNKTSETPSRSTIPMQKELTINGVTESTETIVNYNLSKQFSKIPKQSSILNFVNTSYNKNSPFHDENQINCSLFDAGDLSPIKTKDSQKRKVLSDVNQIIRSTPLPNKNKMRDYTFFGFDDSHYPVEHIKAKPTRINLKDIEIALENQEKSKPEKIEKVSEEVPQDIFEIPLEIQEDKEDDSKRKNEIGGLFEDLEKPPPRQSYTNSKKKKRCEENNSSHDNSDSFNETVVKPKKKKKEKVNKEFEEWAKSFNALCEDVEQYSLEIE